MNAKQPRTVAALKPAVYNPRRISPTAAKALERSMREFGDLSGFVFNARTGRLVTGHQRKERLPADAKIVRTDDWSDDVGTVGYGYADVRGTRWPVRFVDWNETKEKAANLAANNPLIGGEWTDGLDAVLADVENADPDLAEGLLLSDLDVPDPTHVDDSDLDDGTEAGDVPGMELQPFEHYDYREAGSRLCLDGGDYQEGRGEDQRIQASGRPVADRPAAA